MRGNSELSFFCMDFCKIVGGRVPSLEKAGDGVFPRVPPHWTRSDFRFFQSLSLCIFQTFIDKKAVLSKRWQRNAPYTWVPWKFSGLPDYAHGTIPNIFMGFCSDQPYECSYKIWSP